MNDAPQSPELVSVLRDQAFDEIEHVANKAASYSRSISEAAFRGDDVEVLVHLKQLKACLISMIRTYKEFFDEQ